MCECGREREGDIEERKMVVAAMGCKRGAVRSVAVEQLRATYIIEIVRGEGRMCFMLTRIP
jgi:RNase adaptor protein for sRNA GlmZ degradation